MPSEHSSDVEFEIGHVLFVDIVGYSKLLINEQRELLEQLNQVVRGTETFREAEEAGKLIKLPAGDGMALVFSNTPEAPVRCALEISRALKSRPHLRVRIGVHSGPVSGVLDVTDRANVAGAGINIAQRVMSCGDTGHILISKRLPDDLAQYRHWNSCLHDLGECEVKHGVRIGLVNLYTDEVRNPDVPLKLQSEAGHARSRARTRWILLGAAGLILISLGAFFWWQAKRPLGTTQSASAIPEKSISVLPFENFSDSKENEFFSDGISEEIINALTKVKALRVASRTSSFAFKGKTKQSGSASRVRAKN